MAPISGRIGEASSGPGNLVGPATGTLATIVAQDPIHVAFPVAAREFLETRRRAGAAGAGGLGVRVGSTVESLYREIRALRIYEGATEVQQLIVGRDVLGA